MSKSPLQKLHVHPLAAVTESLYVLDVDATQDSAKVVASLSDHSLRVFDIGREAFLHETTIIRAHRKPISSIECSICNPSLLYSCSEDKTAAIWDLRQISKAVMDFRFPDDALAVSSSMNDSLLAVASGTSILFYDTRKGDKKLLGEYSDLHSNIVTNLKFNRQKSSILSSGGEDGLICTFDTAVKSDDSAIISILNTDCPVRKLGYFGADSEGVFCLSSTEKASFWHYPSAQRLGNFNMVREEYELDYLVNCFYDEVKDDVYLLGGRYGGDTVITRVEPATMSVVNVFSNGHDDVVRSGILADGHLITGGEDGHLCTWDGSMTTSSQPPLKDNEVTSSKKRKII